MTATLKTEPRERARVRKLLKQERKVILEERDHYRIEPDQREADLLDAATDEVARDFSERLDEQRSRRLAQIERAEERLRSGTYGICAFCDEPIPSWRLEAIPWAELCLRCQDLTEGMGR